MSDSQFSKDGLVYPVSNPPATDQALQIAPGIRWVRMALDIDLDHINLYIVDSDDEGYWIVDTGLGGDNGRSFWGHHLQHTCAGKNLAAVLCTHMHNDHTGMAGWLCRQYRVPLYMSLSEYLSCRLYFENRRTVELPDDDDSNPVEDYFRSTDAAEATLALVSGRGGGGMPMEPLPKVFRRLLDGHTLSIGGREWKAMTGRGHSPEHICLYNSSDGILLAGDQILPRITPNISVLPMDPEANPLLDWFSSLDYFATLPDQTLVLPAHGLPFYGLQTRIKQVREHHHQRLDSLLQACRNGWQSARELLQVMFGRELSGYGELLGLGECTAHLNYLLAQGALKRRRSDSGRNQYRSS